MHGKSLKQQLDSLKEVMKFGVIFKFSPYFIDTGNEDVTRMLLRVENKSDSESAEQIVYFDPNGTAHLIDFQLKYTPKQCIVNLTRI